jgi:hypothetical protein
VIFIVKEWGIVKTFPHQTFNEMITPQASHIAILELLSNNLSKTRQRGELIRGVCQFAFSISLDKIIPLA